MRTKVLGREEENEFEISISLDKVYTPFPFQEDFNLMLKNKTFFEPENGDITLRYIICVDYSSQDSR